VGGFLGFGIYAISKSGMTKKAIEHSPDDVCLDDARGVY
jgi:hypothetical protein